MAPASSSRKKNWPKIRGEGKYALTDADRTCMHCLRGEHDTCEEEEHTFCLCFEEEHEESF